MCRALRGAKGAKKAASLVVARRAWVAVLVDRQSAEPVKMLVAEKY